MAPAFQIDPIDGDHPGVAALAREASSDGFLFLVRLIAEWESGTNRFDRPGERLLGAFAGGQLIGIRGLNRDPYLEEEAVGRLRHLYVSKAARSGGAGSALVKRLVEEADPVFRLVRLRTDTLQAASFYAKRGFVAVQDCNASHVKLLRSFAG